MGLKIVSMIQTSDGLVFTDDKTGRHDAEMHQTFLDLKEKLLNDDDLYLGQGSVDSERGAEDVVKWMMTNYTLTAKK